MFENSIKPFNCHNPVKQYLNDIEFCDINLFFVVHEISASIDYVIISKFSSESKHDKASS